MRKVLFILSMLVAFVITGCATADAGKDLVVKSGDKVVLDGSKSKSTTNKKLKYKWKQILGKKVKLENANSVKASFIAPDVKKDTKLKFALTVSEVGQDSVNLDYVSVLVKPNKIDKDTTPPVITLNGDSNITLYVGDKYKELGATATDNKDGNITVEIKGSVDTSKEGVYTINYSAKDKAGNIAKATRVVTVLAKQIAMTTIRGTITDVEGKPLPGAKVFNGDKSSLTDGNGEYELNVSKSDEIPVSVLLDGYMQNTKIAKIKDDKNSELNTTLVKVDITKDFNTTSGSTINVKDAVVKLPKGAYVKEDGTPYTGVIVAKVTYHRVSTQDGRKAFPGDFTGETISGDKTVLISYGFIDVTLETKDGEKLNLDDTQEATLKYPVDPTFKKKPNDGDEIPLWYFDTKKGIWVEDGSAKYNAKTKLYEGTVKHFSTWNLDAKSEKGSYTGCIEDANGKAIKGAYIGVEGNGWNRDFHNNDNNFTLINVPANTQIKLNAYRKDKNLTSDIRTFTLSANENRIDNQCLKIDKKLSDIATLISGKIVDKDKNKFSFDYTISDLNKTILYSGKSSTNTIFKSSIFKRPLNNKVIFKATIKNEVIFSKKVDLNKMDIPTDIGTNIADMSKTALITGRVIGKDNKPLYGVFIKNTAGFIYGGTDKNGVFNFALAIPANNKIKLVFKCYQTELPLEHDINNNKSILDLGTIKLNIDVKNTNHTCNIY